MLKYGVEYIFTEITESSRRNFHNVKLAVLQPCRLKFAATLPLYIYIRLMYIIYYNKIRLPHYALTIQYLSSKQHQKTSIFDSLPNDLQEMCCAFC